MKKYIRNAWLVTLVWCGLLLLLTACQPVQPLSVAQGTSTAPTQSSQKSANQAVAQRFYKDGVNQKKYLNSRIGTTVVKWPGSYTGGGELASSRPTVHNWRCECWLDDLPSHRRQWELSQVHVEESYHVPARSAPPDLSGRR